MPDPVNLIVSTLSAIRAPVAPNNQTAPLVTPLRSLNVAQIEPRYSALCAAGMIYGLSSGVVANAKVPLVDIPTTTAAWAIYNGNATTDSPPYCLHILEIGVHLASGTSDIGATLWAGLSPTIQASAVTNATGIVGPKSCSASGDRTSLATLGGAVTLAGAPAWLPVGGFANHAAAATPGSGAVFSVEGSYIIKPGFALGLTVISGLGTSAKYAVSVKYAEVPTYIVS